MNNEKFDIREASTSDAAAIASIYNWYVEHTVITFELQAVGTAQMQERMAGRGRQYPWLVWEKAGVVAGFAYAAPFRPREAYRHSVETTIYLDRGCLGLGAGRQLYGSLIELLLASGHHCALSAIALPNEASVALHERLGFEQVGHLREVGFKFDRWIDVGYWQLALHR